MSSDFYGHIEQIPNKVRQRLDQILEKADLPERHTHFQIKRFIIGKECTIQAKLWQIIRELTARKESIDSLERQIEDSKDNLELMDVNIDRQKFIQQAPFQSVALHEHELKSREAAIHIRKIEREKKQLKAAISKIEQKLLFLEEEVQYFLAAFDELQQIEELRPLDDAEVQAEFWSEKLLEEFNLRLLLKHPLDSELVKTILALPDDAPVKKHTISMLENVQRLITQNNAKVLGQIKQDKNQ